MSKQKKEKLRKELVFDSRKACPKYYKVARTSREIYQSEVEVYKLAGMGYSSPLSTRKGLIGILLLGLVAIAMGIALTIGMRRLNGPVNIWTFFKVSWPIPLFVPIGLGYVFSSLDSLSADWVDQEGNYHGNNGKGNSWQSNDRTWHTLDEISIWEKDGIFSIENGWSEPVKAGHYYYTFTCDCNNCEYKCPRNKNEALKEEIDNCMRVKLTDKNGHVVAYKNIKEVE